MPASFHPDLLRTSLAPLNARKPLCTHAKAYQRFYGLDLPVHSADFGERDRAFR
ncbi:hypothetical protein EC913_105190 [Pseudomonas sp. LP_4_YM]|nr:hypothetical protein EC913_105190 [Pseudomonas sp. LP_4_YM]